MKFQRYVLACIVLAVALSVFAMPATAVTTLKTVQQNGTVLLGEKGLDITSAVGGAGYIAFWEPDHAITLPPDRQINLAGYVQTNFDIDSNFVGTEGKGFWWRYVPGQTPTQPAFQVLTPSASIRVRSLVYNTDITNGAARLGNEIDFKIESTTLQYIQLRNPAAPFDCDLKIYNPGMVEYQYLWTPDDSYNKLYDLPLSTSPFYWSSLNGIASSTPKSWNTGKQISFSNVYPYGTYTAKLVCSENQLNFSSVPVTVTLYEDKLDLSISPSTFTRGNKTYATIRGVPNTLYLLWVKDCTGKMTGYECDQPPYMTPDQDFVYFSDYQGYDFGDTLIDCEECFGCIKTVRDTVPDYPDDGIYYYALVYTDENGERTVEWQTSVDTKPGTYIFRAQPWEPDDLIYYDSLKPYVERTVTVNKGELSFQTIVLGEVNNTAYLGETVCIRGINRDSRVTYLFIKGPCQACPGSDLMVEGTVVTGAPWTFTKVDVRPDGRWEYIWETKYLDIDLGQYTIYAASKPDDAQALECVPCNDCNTIKCTCAAWAKRPFTFLEPTLIVDINPKVVKIQCCEEPPIVVSGRATGVVGDTITYVQPRPTDDIEVSSWDHGQDIQYHPAAIAFWVFGENKVAGEKYIFNITDVDCPGGTFAIDITDYFNALSLVPGEYKVIVQHPMYNHRLDIIPEPWIWELSEYYHFWWHKPYLQDEIWYPDASKKFVVTASPVRWSKLFIIDGPDRLVGKEASGALIEGFEDRNIDDKIVVLNFKVESNSAITADFSGSPVSGTKPLTVQFTDISTGTPTSWLWSFGDGSTSTSANPSHVYLEQGTYNVSLTVANAGGSSTTAKSNYITVAGISPTVTPTPVPPTGNTINLYTGWNFVSTPRTLADGANTVAVVFSGVDRAGRPIYLYDAGTGMWQAMTNTSVIKPLDGLWIYSVGSKSIPLTFKNDPLATPPTKMVYSGWNAIGFSDVNAAAAKDALQSVSDKWVSAIGFNAAGQSYESSIIKGGSGSHADTNPMYPTKGYWLFMNADGTLAAISA
jgi:PKD repeat protein